MMMIMVVIEVLVKTVMVSVSDCGEDDYVGGGCGDDGNSCDCRCGEDGDGGGSDCGEDGDVGCDDDNGGDCGFGEDGGDKC